MTAKPWPPSDVWQREWEEVALWGYSGHPAPSSRAGCGPAHALFIGPALFWRTQMLHQERCILGGPQNQKT